MKHRIIVTLLLFVGCIAIGTFGVPEGAAAVFQEINSQNAALSGESGANFTVTDDPRIVFARAVGFVLSLLGIGFTVYVMYGGALIFISKGDQDQIKRGKGTIVTGVIGTLIILSAYIITQFVTDALVKSTQADDCDTGAGCLYIQPDTEIDTDPLASPRQDERVDDTFWENLR